MFKEKKAFTLVEIMIGILIVSIVIISGFEAYTKVGIGKIRLMEKTDMQKDSFFFSEKFFQLVKNGGTIDYEEYFNRKVVGNTTFSSGHYDRETGFGNFGESGIVGISNYGAGFYLCRSGDDLGDKMTGSGCYDNNNLNIPSDNYTGKPQRYGQYSYQFIDYNSNYDTDLGDENGDLDIVGDDDDEYLGLGPEVFNSGTDVKELYLISGDKKIRTLFRWNVEQDSFAPAAEICNAIGDDGCRGTIEFLVLEGKDWGLDHNDALPVDSDGSQSDGVIDTWLIGHKFSGLDNISLVTSIVAGSNSINYRKPLFSDNINVTDFKVFLYPNIDIDHAWKSSEISHNISPYVTLNFEIKPSWEKRIRLRNDSDPINFNTTINLTDIFSK